MKAKYLITVLLLAVSFCSNAQDESTWGGDHPQMAFTGGGLQLSFGTVTFVEISPMIGYNFNKFFSAGVGGSFAYMNDHYYKVDLPFYSGRGFAELNITPVFYLHAEYELVFYKDKFSFLTTNNQWTTLENIWAGVGYKQIISDRVSLYGVVMYNLNNPPVYTPFENLTYRAGIEYHFNLKKGK